MIAPLFLALALQWNRQKQSWLRVLCALFVLFAAAIVVVTQSRGAYLAAAVSTALVIGLRRPRALLLLPTAMIALIGTIWWLGINRILNLIGRDNALGGIDVRAELWGNSLLALSDFRIYRDRYRHI